jgi:hypothetical protein
MKGTGYCHKDEEGRTITSLDGYRSYFIIIDKLSRYTWGFLTKTKAPPLKMLEQFLKEHGNKTSTHRTIRTDQGGELWASQDFRQLVMDTGYILEPTASGAPFQNGLAEWPNQTLGTMTRCLLHSANLGPEYWSFALLHAVYLKNRPPHTATNDTPYHCYTGSRPSAKNLRVFGCPVIAKNPGKRATKLDLNTSTGIFLGYTATDKNIYYMDNNTKRLKISTHCIFEEASMTLPEMERSAVAKALQQAGFTNEPETVPKLTTPLSPAESAISVITLQVQLLSDHAKYPTRATDGAAGYDLFSATDVFIQPNQ